MFYTGVVEDRFDPLKLGRLRVRIVGFHTGDKIELPTEDLPWAVVMQSIVSAATSGVGYSPTGIVEGAYVIVIFQDEHQQQPIVIGTIGGIPAANKNQTITIVKTSESLAFETTDGSTVVAPNAVLNTPLIRNSGEIKKPTPALLPSDNCYNLIKNEEKLSSLTEGKNNFVSPSRASSLSELTEIFAYQDTSNIWTIGWGNTTLQNGSAVTASTKITKKEADDLLVYKVLNEFAAGVRRNLQAPVTQSMFDSLVAIAYNTGVTGLVSSGVFSAINTMDYEGAASQILVLRTNNGLLSDRRKREKNLFAAEGFPRRDMSAINPPLTETLTTPDDASQNPVVSLKPTSNVGENIDLIRRIEGFRDPNGVYPKTVGEPDTHRLARHEKVDQTIVFSKEAARAKDIKTGGDEEWTQPKIPYDATYPYNQVRATESGHLEEFDDTEGRERIHRYHRAGTYEEIDKNGTRVNRIVGDDYEIIERNGHVLIRGTMNVTIIGNNNVRIENDSTIDVLGNVNLSVGGDMETGVSGDYKMKVDGKFIIDAKEIDFKVRENFYIAVNENFEIGVKQDFKSYALGMWAVDANPVEISSGSAVDVDTELPEIIKETDQIQMGKGPATGVPEFPKLTAPSRLESDEGQYETPEDGDPAEYEKKLDALGAGTGPILSKQVQSVIPEEKLPAPINRDCKLIPSTGEVDRNFRLSPNYVLKDLDLRNVISAEPVVALSRAEIVCNLKSLAENCLEPIRQLYPSAKITSGYRNYVPAGGSTNSDHLYGAAADIVIGGYDRAQHYAAVQEIAKILPAYTQLILEYRGTSTIWIHVAFNEKRGLRMQKLTINNGKTVAPAGSFTLLG
jgi:GH24 family phage-related lysozyme (muramidase)/uncharacterized protein YcbK (DUF882 family)